MSVDLHGVWHEATAARRLTVLLIGPTALVRVALRQLLGAAPNVVVIGDVLPEEEALELARRNPPDIALVDTPDLGSALPLIRSLLAVSPETRPIILSDEEFGDGVLQAAAAGVWGILPRDLSQGELIRAIRQVSRGKVVIACALEPEQLARLRELGGRHHASGPAIVLTDREASVMRAVAAGHTDTQIARQLGVAVPTIKSHIRTILRKTRAANRAAAIAVAYRSGLLT